MLFPISELDVGLPASSHWTLLSVFEFSLVLHMCGVCHHLPRSVYRTGKARGHRAARRLVPATSGPFLQKKYSPHDQRAKHFPPCGSASPPLATRTQKKDKPQIISSLYKVVHFKSTPAQTNRGIYSNPKLAPKDPLWGLLATLRFPERVGVDLKNTSEKQTSRKTGWVKEAVRDKKVWTEGAAWFSPSQLSWILAGLWLSQNLISPNETRVQPGPWCFFLPKFPFTFSFPCLTRNSETLRWVWPAFTHFEFDLLISPPNSQVRGVRPESFPINSLCVTAA